MPNRKYVSGRSLEYKVKADMEEEGFSVIRASGSHGIYDLVGVMEMQRSGRVFIRCVQCKVTSSKNVEALKREFYSSVPTKQSHNIGPIILEQVLVVKTKGHKNYDSYTLPECS